MSKWMQVEYNSHDSLSFNTSLEGSCISTSSADAIKHLGISWIPDVQRVLEEVHTQCQEHRYPFDRGFLGSRFIWWRERDRIASLSKRRLLDRVYILHQSLNWKLLRTRSGWRSVRRFIDELASATLYLSRPL